jgi:glycosyltransferase involved in cell wall biosynthesis
MKISIIVPVYHEEKNIVNVFKQIKKLVKTEYELLAVYDSKEDPTYPVMSKYLSKKRLNNIILVENNSGDKRGVMNAIKTGFKKAKGDAVVVLMADLSDDITQIDEMKKLIDSGYDIVCASRYMKGGKKIGGPFIKSLLSKTAGLTLHWFFGVPTHDSTNAFKMYKKKVLNSIKVESTGGFEYSLKIVLKAYKKGYKIKEIPTVWIDRVNGKSNFKLFIWLPNYIKQYSRVFK